MTRKLFGGLLLVFFVLILTLFSLLAPRMVETHLEELLSNYVQAEFAQVDLGASRGLPLLTGRIAHVEVAGQGWNIAGLAVENLSLQAREAKINIWQLIFNNQFVYEGARTLEVTAAVQEEDLNRYLWQQVDPRESFAIRLEPNGVLLEGSINLLGNAWDVTLQGELAVKDGDKIVFAPQEMAIQEARVPALLLELISERYGTILDLSALPVPLVVREIQMLQDRILVYANGAY